MFLIYLYHKTKNAFKKIYEYFVPPARKRPPPIQLETPLPPPYKDRLQRPSQIDNLFDDFVKGKIGSLYDLRTKIRQKEREIHSAPPFSNRI